MKRVTGHQEVRFQKAGGRTTGKKSQNMERRWDPPHNNTEESHLQDTGKFKDGKREKKKKKGNKIPCCYKTTMGPHRGRGNGDGLSFRGTPGRSHYEKKYRRKLADKDSRRAREQSREKMQVLEVLKTA